MAKPEGWFSRRQKTAEAFIAYQGAMEAKVEAWRATMAANAKARAERTPAQQIAVLNARLGKGKGAKKERARLKLQMGK